jgi:hypothetical protein
MAEYYNFKEGLNSKGKMLTLEQIDSLIVDPNKDYYLSIYKYTEDQKKQVENTGTVWSLVVVLLISTT